MSDTNKRNTSRKRVASTEDMDTFLAGMNIAVKPRLHVNGSSFPNAILSVDFGEPLEPIRLTNEQMHDLVSNMRSLARDVLGRDASININTDGHRGVYWASVG